MCKGQQQYTSLHSKRALSRGNYLGSSIPRKQILLGFSIFLAHTRHGLVATGRQKFPPTLPESLSLC